MIKTAAPSTLERLDVLESTNSSFYLTRPLATQKNARWCCVLQCIIAILLITNLLALSLGVLNLVNTFTTGTLTGTPAEDGGLDDTVSRLRTELEELKRNVSACGAKHDTDLAEILQQLQANCPPPTLSGATTVLPGVSTTPLPAAITTSLPDTTTPPLTSGRTSVPIYENCTTIRMGSCSISSLGLLGSSPAFASCSTTPISLDDNSDGHVLDVFCSVSLDQLMPAASTLLFNAGSVSCVCNALEIPNAVQTQLVTFDCELYVKRCPLEIQIPLN